MYVCIYKLTFTSHLNIKHLQSPRNLNIYYLYIIYIIYYMESSNLSVDMM